MLRDAGIARNFQLMVVQVTKQLENTLRMLDKPDADLRKAIYTSDDYIDTQKSMIENQCYSLVAARKIEDERVVDSIRALNIITTNLERLADLSVNVTRQTQYLEDYDILKRTVDYRVYFHHLLEGIGLIREALLERDSSLGIRICRIEAKIDQLYENDLRAIMERLPRSDDAKQLLTVIFIISYLERMGDALLNIGEAVIFAVLGERLKIRQYHVLDEALSSSRMFDRSLSDVELESIWGTRSGVRIGTVEDQDESSQERRKVVFKGGNADKLQKEVESLKQWEKIAPGLAPSVVEYTEKEHDAALLIEYFDGSTFQEITMSAPEAERVHALSRVCETLRRIWCNTKADKAVNGRYLGQLRARLEDVARLHSFVHGRDVRIGDLDVPSLDELLVQAGAVADSLDAPFSVFIHGDLNLDNIIFNRDNDALHFIDVHRSREMDYVQDVSVFLVSAFRLPVFDTEIRRRLEDSADGFLTFARQFAADHDDVTFEARLALGLIRSFITSMRFEVDARFARAMYDRAILLLNKLLAKRQDDLESFRVPRGVLVY